MALFKEKKTKKPATVIASAPEEPESIEELKHMEGISKKEVMNVQEEEQESSSQYQQVPMCISQTQVNNITIETNRLVKWIVNKIQEEE